MLYTYVIRYHHFGGNQRLKSSFVEFFGTENNSQSVLFPYGIKDCLNILRIEEKEYLENHSVMPYYRLFLKADVYNEICREIFCGKKSYTLRLLGQQKQTSSIKSDRIYYCPKCLQDNRGYGGLKTYHQVKDVHVCPVHHCYLNSIPVSRTGKLLDMKTWNMDVRECEQGGVLEQIAEDVEYIIDHPLEIDNGVLRKWLYDEAALRGAMQNGKVLKEGWNNDWKHYFDNLPVEYKKYQDSANFQLFGSRHILCGVEPVEYLLFIRSLFGSFKKMLELCLGEEDDFSEIDFDVLF